MRFELEPGQETLRDSAREVADAIRSRAHAFEIDQRVPADVYVELGARGLMAVGVPRAYGGTEAGTVAYSLAMTEIASACASTAVTMAVTNMVGEVIAAFGTEPQRTAWCPRLAAGEHGAFALSEVGAGSDPGGMTTTAREVDGGWEISGTKQWISHGDTSCVLVVWARTDGAGPRGLSCFLVPGNAPGLKIASHEDKLGLRASHTVALELDAIRVPADALLGERGGGFPIAMMALDGGRIGIGSQALGIAQGAFDYTMRVLSERVSSEHRPDQGALWRVADIETRLSAARQLVLRAAWAKQEGEAFSMDASIAKAFATEAAWTSCNECVELLGEDALAADHPVQRALRDVRVTMIYEGTSEVQRIVIGRHALRG